MEYVHIRHTEHYVMQTEEAKAGIELSTSHNLTDTYLIYVAQM